MKARVPEISTISLAILSEDTCIEDMEVLRSGVKKWIAEGVFELLDDVDINTVEKDVLFRVAIKM